MPTRDERFAEYLDAMKAALKEADVDAPDAFAEKLADGVADDLSAYYVNYEISPSEVKEWYESEDSPAFMDWLGERLAGDPVIDLEWNESVRLAIQDALKDRAFGEWGDAAGKARSRADEIADHLTAGLPFPELRIMCGDPRFRCDIVMGTPEDRNTEYGTNEHLAEWLILEKPLPFQPDSALGSFGWLIQSQGRSLYETGALGGKFAESFRRELIESAGYYGAPAFCVGLSIKDLEHFKAGGSFRIDPGVACGNLEMFSGAGGIFGIELEKPVIIDKSLVMELQIEEAKNRFHTVDDVYGFTRGQWATEVGLVEEKAARPRLFTKAETIPVIDEAPKNRERMRM